jgi:predicted RNA binding protein YcfA (HicA-like mRNA interferase family)
MGQLRGQERQEYAQRWPQIEKARKSGPFFMVAATGLEPVTFGLLISQSGQRGRKCWGGSSWPAHRPGPPKVVDEEGFAVDTVCFMKIRDLIKLLNQDGWFLVAQVGSHRQFRHPTKPGRVTVAGSLGDDLAVGTLNSIKKQANIEVGRR